MCIFTRCLQDNEIQVLEHCEDFYQNKQCKEKVTEIYCVKHPYNQDKQFNWDEYNKAEQTMWEKITSG